MDKEQAREIELFNHAEWVEGWDPMGSGDLYDALFSWMRVHDNGTDTPEVVMTKFKQSFIWGQFFPKEFYYPGTSQRIAE